MLVVTRKVWEQIAIGCGDIVVLRDNEQTYRIELRVNDFIHTDVLEVLCET